MQLESCDVRLNHGLVTLHEQQLDTYHCCDFSPIYPPSVEDLKPIRYRDLSPAYLAELIKVLVRNLDNFYKPRIRCRRKFSPTRGLIKYYPDEDKKVDKQVSFLHHERKRKAKTLGNSGDSREMRNVRKNILTVPRRYDRSVSLYEPNWDRETFNPALVPPPSGLPNLNGYKNDRFLTQDFIMAERFAYFMESGKTKFMAGKKDQTNVDGGKSNVFLRQKKVGVGFRLKRKSFPLTSMFESVSWMLGG
ncbi:hypothetical protein WA026_009374 [Henosepilachna vigintioctopunctata]|uniref:Uncharacterized protein n=1 Tax=Henosepilachna vigintioctopunctata TaxID=420089 RepID=A0AAW1U4I0_9CUCU